MCKQFITVLLLMLLVPTSVQAADDYRAGIFDQSNTYSTTCASGLFNNSLGDQPYNAKTFSCDITLNTETNIKSFFIKIRRSTGDANSFTLTMYNAAGTQVYSNKLYEAKSGSFEYYKSVGQKVKKVSLVKTNSSYSAGIFELELFAAINYIPVSEIAVDVDVRSAATTFKNPKSDQFVRTDVLLNGTLAQSSSAGTVNFKNLKPSTAYKITYRSYYVDGNYIDAVSNFTTLPDTTAPANVSLTASVVDQRVIDLTYTLPTDEDFAYVQIYRDDVLVKDNYTDTSYTDTSTKFDTSYTYKVVSVDSSGNKSTGATAKVKTKKRADVTNLKALGKDTKDVQLTYTLPTYEDFAYVQIYRNNVLVKDNYTDTSYTDTSTKFDTSYTYKVISVYASGDTSAGVSTSIKTQVQASPDVSQLRATATSNSVALSWQNTKRDGFESVTIYRKQKTIAANVRALFSAGDGYTPIFTTNGTEFTDLTVGPDTSYTYKVTTTIDGVETAGVTVDVKTKPVSVEGGAVDTDDNGDYVLTWTAPTTGKLKVLIDGKEYKIVQASDKKVVIPAALMVYDFWGNPKVTLVPVNDAGEDVGKPTPPKPSPEISGGSLLPPLDELKGVIDVPNLVATGMSLLGLIGGFVLLRLAFLFVPRLIKTIRRSWR